jgi:hypothetical protein
MTGMAAIQEKEPADTHERDELCACLVNSSNTSARKSNRTQSVLSFLR